MPLPGSLDPLWRCVGRVQRAFPVRGGVLGDSVGYGKTAVALALVAADTSGAPTLVVVPPHLVGHCHPRHPQQEDRL